MDTIEQVGALVGIVAFLALAVLAVLFFLQAREVRRLRDWAGRAPERAAAIAEREALEAASERAEAAETIAGPTRLDRFRERYSGWSRKMPVDPLYIGAVVIGLIVAAGFVTGGFGVLGGDDGQVAEAPPREPSEGPKEPEQTDVAVLNATQLPGVSPVPGAAQDFATEVSTLGYRLDEVDDAPDGIDLTTVMYRKGHRREARQLAAQLEPALSGTPIEVEQMSADVIRLLGNTEIALVIGRNYQPEVPAEPEPVDPVPVDPTVTPVQ